MSINTKLLFEAKMELSEFLKKNPELREMQKSIEIELNKRGSKHNRLVYINHLMVESAQRLGAELNKLLHGI